MSQILTPSQINQPRLVTIRELRAKLLPLTFGYKWGEDAIHDLWKLGAPVPVNPGEEERRILLPKQFERWWYDVAEKKGHDATGGYTNVAKGLRANAGQSITSRQR